MRKILTVILSLVAVVFAVTDLAIVENSSVTAANDFSDSAVVVNVTVRGTVTGKDSQADKGINAWVEVDGEKISHTTVTTTPTSFVGSGSPSDWKASLSVSFNIELQAGESKTVDVVNADGFIIEALYIYDVFETQACGENPENDPVPITAKSVLASGPSIGIPGATAVYDVNGREIGCEISNDRIRVSELSSGIYYVQTANSETVKVTVIK